MLWQSPGFNSLDLAALQITLRLIMRRSHEFHFVRFCSVTESCFSLRLILQRSHGFYFARFCTGATEFLCANLRFDWGVFNTYWRTENWRVFAALVCGLLFQFSTALQYFHLDFRRSWSKPNHDLGGWKKTKLRSISAHDGWKNWESRGIILIFIGVAKWGELFSTMVSNGDSQIGEIMGSISPLGPSATISHCPSSTIVNFPLCERFRTWILLASFVRWGVRE